MKILGLRSEVIGFILEKVETYLPDYSADSFEEYEKKCVEGIISLVEKSVPFFKIEENFKIILEEKAREYAEKHFLII